MPNGAADVDIAPEEMVLLNTAGAAQVENPPNSEIISNNNQELEKSPKDLECLTESAAEKSSKKFTLNKMLRHSRNKSVVLKDCPEGSTTSN